MNNIVLFGFMGCGKSTVGALLAQKSGRPLLDTDGYLEQKYGRTIPQIFATDGEEAFRQMERQVCRELAGRTGLDKGENIRLVMARNGVRRAVYVGDTQGDADAAKKAGVPLIFAAYGFGRVADAEYVIQEISELPSILEQIFSP